MATQKNDLEKIKGIGERRIAQLQKLGISDADTLCRFYPRDYKDWSHPCTIADAPIGEVCCVRARITDGPTTRRVRKGMTLYRALAADDSGSVLYITIFNNRFAAEKLKMGKAFLFYGKITGNRMRKEMTAPEIEAADCAAIRPIYRCTEGLSSRMVESYVRDALRGRSFLSPIPPAVRNRYRLCDLATALQAIHFPKDEKALAQARRYLIFEELFLLQIGLKRLKGRDRGQTAACLTVDALPEFEALLPFSLTGAQKRVIQQATADLQRTQPMNRLVQGDVGSGKTAVAAALGFSMIRSGYQVAMMAPTEILAEQHYRSLSALLKGSGVAIGLLTGSATQKEKSRIKAALAAGDIQFLVGTHALLEENVAFEKLGLVITDEQHRFGVAQRATLAAKGDNPHILVMSATPIPRTLALAIYGDLDISSIDELPPGRKPIQTYCVGTALRERAYNYVKKHLDEGRQGYIVCPLVEENESALTSAVAYAEQLSKGAFQNYTVELLHGQMKPSEKEAVMRRFADGQTQLLVSTTVIEVGVDVPNAVIMVIEDADRFGLSQLHQLRGRIGRGKHASTCILITDAKGETAAQRMKIMCATNDGFQIADADLKLRGPGDFFGRRQHGLPDLKVADLSDNMEMLRAAGREAEEILSADPNLDKAEHQLLKTAVDRLFASADAAGL